LRLQFLGGLEATEIVGVFTKKVEARKLAQDLLDNRFPCTECGKLASPYSNNAVIDGDIIVCGSCYDSKYRFCEDCGMLTPLS